MTIILTVLIAMSLCALLVMCVNCMLGTCHGICKPYFLGKYIFICWITTQQRNFIDITRYYLLRYLLRQNQLELNWFNLKYLIQKMECNSNSAFIKKFIHSFSKILYIVIELLGSCLVFTYLIKSFICLFNFFL